MASLKGSAEGKVPSRKSLNELMKLLMKLNTKLREKLSPHSAKEVSPKMDVVIIIMTNQQEKAKVPKTSRSAKSQAPKDDWINNLCEDIEKKTSS